MSSSRKDGLLGDMLGDDDSHDGLFSSATPAKVGTKGGSGGLFGDNEFDDYV